LTIADRIEILHGLTHNFSLTRGVFYGTGTALLIAAFTPAKADEHIESLEFRFPLVAVEKPDERTLTRYRKRTRNLQCELVEFDASRLLDLILRVESGKRDVSQSSVVLHLFEREGVQFFGHYFEVVREHGRVGPYIWSGQLAIDPYFKATFVITRDFRVSGRIDAADNFYSMSQSAWSNDHFLCELDQMQLPKKID
jgi:hypothetical protein